MNVRRDCKRLREDTVFGVLASLQTATEMESQTPPTSERAHTRF